MHEIFNAKEHLNSRFGAEGLDEDFTACYRSSVGRSSGDSGHYGARGSGRRPRGIEWLYRAPASADPAEQAQLVSALIEQKVDALVIAPNDPETMGPLIAQAEAAGIQTLVLGEPPLITTANVDQFNY